MVDSDFIYINSYDDKLYCVSKANGEIIWSVKGGGVSTPIVAGDKLFYTTSKGDLVALAKKDGKELWRYSSDGGGILSDPVLYSGFVTAGESQGSLIFIDMLSGIKKGAFEPGRGVFSRPTASVEQKAIYFISGEGNAYSIRAESSTKASIDYLR